jgi:hypothetical protein
MKNGAKEAGRDVVNVEMNMMVMNDEDEDDDRRWKLK